MVLAGLALLLAALVTFLIYLPPRNTDRRERRPQSPTQPVNVRLVPSAGTGLGYWWRFQTPADAPPTSVDIFSFRSRGAGASTPWRHELMEAALEVLPAQAAHLKAPALATTGGAYDVSIGWTIHRSAADSQGSAIVVVEPEPFT